MAREQEDGAEAIYAFDRRWLSEVLPSGDSLITPGRSIWTLQNLSELEAQFIGQPDTTSGKTFLEKLHGQLASATPGAVQLMAELHVVHFLMVASSAISATRKIADLNTILSWMPTPPTVPTAVTEVMSPGMAHPGRFAMSRRDLQLTWLIYFSQAWASADENTRTAALDDPWRMREFVLAIPGQSADAAQMSVLHLSHPDTFEPIVNTEHKTLIVKRFGHLLPNLPDDTDAALLQVRSALEPEYGDHFGWYTDPLLYRWWRGDAWRKFTQWARRVQETADLDTQEREYKVEIATLLQTARQLAIANDDAWIAALTKAFHHRLNNLSQWQSHDVFLKWVAADPEAGRIALTNLWSTGPWSDRFAEFAQTISSVPGLNTKGTQLNLGSFLLMGTDETAFPVIKIGALERALELVGWATRFKNLDAVAIYHRGLVLFDELVFDSNSWSKPFRDRLDAQGAVWSLVKTKDNAWLEWPEEVWSDFVAWRSTVPPDLDEEDLSTEAGPEQDAPAEVPIDHIAEAAKELFVDRKHLDEIVALLDDKKQVILYGPPGTGKTYLAKRLARALVAGDEDRMSIVQFHPAMSYEDFFEGLRPQVTKAGQVTYSRTDGPLVAIADKAAKDPEQRPHVLLIDEINRANLPKVFGELLFLLEYRDEKVHTVYRPDTKFGLPKNLLIIGTMNTADRSIALIDAAMRRRFHFFPFFPHEGAMKDLLRNWLGDRGRRDVPKLLDAVNLELGQLVGNHLLIGPSHFMRDDLSDAALERIWTYNVFPLIEEQLWSDREEVARWTWKAVSARFLYPAEPTEEAAVVDDVEHQASEAGEDVGA